jgi:membrane protein required for beta-lactamase induction
MDVSVGVRMVYADGVVHSAIALLAVAAEQSRTRPLFNHVLRAASVLGVRHRAADLAPRCNRVGGPAEEPCQDVQKALVTISIVRSLALVFFQAALGKLGAMLMRIALAVQLANTIVRWARRLNLVLFAAARLMFLAYAILIGARPANLVLA